MMLEPKSPYGNLSNAAFAGGLAKGAKKLGSGIQRFGKRIAAPMARDEAELAREQAAEQREANKNNKQKRKRANDTRWANTKHKNELARRAELHAQTLSQKAELEANRTGAAVDRAEKLKKVREAGKPPATTKTGTGNKKPAATKAPRTGKDNLLEPVAPNKPKKPSTAKRPVVDTKAGDLYND